MSNIGYQSSSSSLASCSFRIYSWCFLLVLVQVLQLQSPVEGFTTTKSTFSSSLPSSSSTISQNRPHCRQSVSFNYNNNNDINKQSSFSSSSSSSSSSFSNSVYYLIPRNLVTQEDVIKAVEYAESLWAQALEARKTANALSDRAEEEAEAAAEASQQVEEMVNNRTTISMEQLAKADAAASANLDATVMVNKALEALKQADELERQAELALQDSEAQLEQHLQDFPDSPLGK